MKKIAVCIAALATLASWAREKPAVSDPLIDVGTHRLQIRVEGRGSPVVVIDAGIGDSLDKLKPLQEVLARVTRVVTYNRAGYGGSDPGPLPRDCGREADELAALLAKASLPGPYVLVGHSLGALNVQVFASRHPGSVAGLVLLDPPPLSFLLGREHGDLARLAGRMTSEWQVLAEAAAGSSDPEDLARSAYYRAIASEHREMFGASARLVERIANLDDIPLVVMAAGKPNPGFGKGAAEFQKFWIGQNRELAARSAKGRFILAERSTHYLYLDDPALVVRTVLDLVEKVRGR